MHGNPDKEFPDLDKIKDDQALQFGQQLLSLIERKGLKQGDLAKAAGVSAASISKIINGKSTPKGITLRKILAHLKLTEDETNGLLSKLSSLPASPAPQSTAERIQKRAEKVEIRRWAEKRLNDNGIRYNQEPLLKSEPDQRVVTFDLLIRPSIAVEATPSLEGALASLLEEAETYLSVSKVEHVIILTPFVYESRLPDDIPSNIYVCSTDSFLKTVQRLLQADTSEQED